VVLTAALVVLAVVLSAVVLEAALEVVRRP
jgi:hypothetical protein